MASPIVSNGKFPSGAADLTVLNKEGVMMNKDGFYFQKAQGGNQVGLGHPVGNDELVVVDQKRRRVQDINLGTVDHMETMAVDSFGPKNGEDAGLAQQVRLDK